MCIYINKLIQKGEGGFGTLGETDFLRDSPISKFAYLGRACRKDGSVPDAVS